MIIKKLLLTVIVSAMTLSFSGCLSVSVDRKDEQTSADSAATLPEIRPEEEPEETLTPIYDLSPIVSAYEDDAEADELSEKDREILERAEKIVEEVITPEMSEVEKIIALHDYITTHATYDSGMLLPIPKKSPDSDNPYGILVNGQGVCMGYTTTFKLLMDMIGVESIIVRGRSSDEEHAWNMVKIGENWYHIDVTWDDFTPDEEGRPPFHLYLLVPDSAMAAEHIWDRETAPKAEADDLIYYKTHGLYSESKEQTAQIIEELKKNGERYAEIMSDSNGALNRDLRSVYSYWISDLGDYVVILYWLV